MRKSVVALLGTVILFMLLLAGCKIYSFTGATIPPDVKTFSVKLFTNEANNGPASLAQVFTDRLKQKLQTEGNLRNVPTDGDLQFSGSIVGYAYTSEAPIAGATSGLNKLTITVRVEFVNTKNEKDNWTKTMPPRFVQFSSSEDILSVENRLIDEINRQLVDDIFNEALVKW